MTPLQFRGQDCLLLDIPPDWSAGIKATVRLLSQVESSLSGREARRPHATTLRWTLRGTIRAPEAEARRLAAALAAYRTQPVLLPLWPAAVRFTDRASAAVSGGLQAAVDQDLRRWEIYYLDADAGLRYWTHKAADGTITTGCDSSLAPPWPGSSDTYLPLLMGRLEKTELSWESPTQATFEVDFTEASPSEYALRPPTRSFAAGPLPSSAWAGPPPILPMPVDAAAAREQFVLEVRRAELGFGRQPAQTLYPQATTRELTTAHSLVLNSELADLLEFFRQCGAGAPFWAYAARAAMRLAEDIAPGQTTLPVSDVADLAVGQWLAFVRPGAHPVAAKITALNPHAPTVTVSPAPGPFGPEHLVARLCLVRWLRPELALSWHNYGLAEAALQLREVPAEIAPAADETLGQTISLLPTRCWLYEFTRTLGGTDYVERVTSYESDLTWAGQTFAARKINHGQIRQGLALDRDEVQIECDLEAVAALRRMATLRLNAPLYLRILAAEASGSTASNGVVFFTGEVTRVSVRGSRLTATATPVGSALDRKLPNFYIGPYCNWSLFSPGCGLSANDWKFTATVSDPGDPGFPFLFQLAGLARVSGPTPVYFEDWFAGGWIEFGSGSSLERLPILRSTTPSGGVLTVTLHRDPDPYPQMGDPVVLYPGCDGRSVTCRAYDASRNPEGKFDNFLNFGGHPFVPPGNPSIVRQTKPGAAAKK